MAALANRSPTSHLCWYAWILLLFHNDTEPSPSFSFHSAPMWSQREGGMIKSPRAQWVLRGGYLTKLANHRTHDLRDKAGWSPFTGVFLLGLREEFLPTCSWSLRNSCHRSCALYMKEAITKAYTLRERGERQKVLPLQVISSYPLIWSKPANDIHWRAGGFVLEVWQRDYFWFWCSYCLWFFFFTNTSSDERKVEPTNLTPTPVIFLPRSMLTMFSNLVTEVFFSKLAQTSLQATRLSTLRGSLRKQMLKSFQRFKKTESSMKQKDTWVMCSTSKRPQD